MKLCANSMNFKEPIKTVFYLINVVAAKVHLRKGSHSNDLIVIFRNSAVKS